MDYCKKEFTVLGDYVPLMKKVAQVACEKYSKGFKMPYLFEEYACLNFDYPKMKSEKITREGIAFRLNLPESPFKLDKEQIGRSLPPLLIQSIDSTVIKHLIILLDKEISEECGFATIHDCVFFPKDVITPDRIQELWNEALIITYKKFGRLYEWIIGIFKLNPEDADKYLKIAEEAYGKWQSNVKNPDYLDKLWMSTDLEY